MIISFAALLRRGRCMQRPNTTPPTRSSPTRCPRAPISQNVVFLHLMRQPLRTSCVRAYAPFRPCGRSFCFPKFLFSIPPPPPCLPKEHFLGLSLDSPWTPLGLPLGFHCTTVRTTNHVYQLFPSDSLFAYILFRYSFFYCLSSFLYSFFREGISNS